MDQSYRLSDVGLINRDKKLSFKFNGKTYYGYEGRHPSFSFNS
jgi:sarcosine oxidase subunit alpha